MLRKLPPEKIYEVITTGSMRTQAESLTDQQKRAIAEWAGGRRLGTTESGDASRMSNPCPSGPLVISNLAAAPSWNGWSPDTLNNRYQTGAAAGMSPAAVSRLQLKWAFGLPATVSAYAQPTMVGGKVFVASDSGYIYAIDGATGCVHWSFMAQSGVRSAIVIGPRSGSTQLAAYFGDVRGNVYALSVTNGELLWKVAVDPHPLSRITAGIKLHNGRLYVPVASLEEPESASVNYPCCTFRGMVATLDAATGKQIWKTYTINETPKPQKTAAGVDFLGPSGAGVWGPVTLDLKRRAVYISTGNAFSAPDVGRSDAVMAMNMDSGEILWVNQVQHGDVWHTGCPQGSPPAGIAPRPPRAAGRAGGRGGAGARRGGGGGQANRPPTYYCPDEKENPDWDFSAGVLLVDMPNGKSLVVAGQKSGMVWAFDPDRKGELVWESDISRGQIVFGGATDGDTGYFAMRSGIGGLAAVRLADGMEKWFVPLPPQESMSSHAGLTAAVTVIPGVVFTSGLDGMVRAFSTFDGRPIWQYDTTQQLETINGVAGTGGSIGSGGVIVANGMLYVTSGYTGFQGGQPGNLLLAFGPPPQ